MKNSHAVGIDLGTTYSCIAWLNEHGQPVTIANQEGELATPSVAFLDGVEFIVGTEALRNVIAHPDRVVQNAKRFMGDAGKVWKIGNVAFTPECISSRILRKLLSAAAGQIGEITEAVITVPAQFSDAQRHATIQAGHSAGLEKVEIINEPVAAALCHVLGSEGLAFTELAIDQRLLIYDLGGGTLDLSVVNYTSDQVRVIASDGDLELGGLDWTRVLVDAAADRFIQEFKEDPRRDPESHQALTLEAEQAKRSLSVRPRAAITVQHAGFRQTWQFEQEEFEHLSRRLLKRSEAITRRILAGNGFSWAHIDVLLTTGGASRMPMVKACLQKLSGRTLNSMLSPDQSIAHGAAYYAGMLLSNSKYARTVFSSKASARLSRIRQQSVNARSLGIIIRDVASGQHVPHYVIRHNTALPVSKTHVFGTVADNQKSVRVRIVESGAGPDKPPTALGECRITGLPLGLPEGSPVEVTISYDTQARVHVAAREIHSNRSSEVEILRQENITSQLQEGAAGARQPSQADTAGRHQRHLTNPAAVTPDSETDQSEFEGAASIPAEDDSVLRCRDCGRPLNDDGECDVCVTDSQMLRNWAASTMEINAERGTAAEHRPSTTNRREKKKSGTRQLSAEDEFWDLLDDS